MKKKFIFTLLFLMMFIPAVNAANCKITSSNNEIVIGDEVTCGTEHFYVTSNDGKNVKMLSKYLLNTGYTAYKQENVTKENFPEVYFQVYEKLAEFYGESTNNYNREEVVNQFFDSMDKCVNCDFDSSFRRSYSAYLEIILSLCENEETKVLEEYGKKYDDLSESEKVELVKKAYNRTFEKFVNIPVVLDWRESDGTITTKWWIPSNTKNVLQDSSILLPQGEKDKNWQYPINNVVPSIIYGNIQVLYSLMFEGGLSYEINAPYTNQYKESLLNMGLPVQNVDFVNVYDFVKLLDNVTDGKLNEKDIFNMMEKDADGISRLDLKTSIPDKYNWIYSNSYWLSADEFSYINDKKREDMFNAYFVDRFGDFCSMGICTYIQDISMGIRPVVTMATNDIIIEEPKEPVVEEQKVPLVNPDTLDDVTKYIVSLIVFMGIIASGTVVYKKRNSN